MTILETLVEKALEKGATKLRRVEVLSGADPHVNWPEPEWIRVNSVVDDESTPEEVADHDATPIRDGAPH